MGRIRQKRLKTNPEIGIFCEGESEKQYFTMLKQKYRLPNIRIKVIAADLSGKKLIEKAIKYGRHNNLERLYVVFDRDEHSKSELIECEKLARKYKIGLLFSSIDFEIWILMHFEPVFRSYSRAELVKKLSGKSYFNQNYNQFKGNSYREFIFDKVQEAVDNADKLYQKNNNLIDDDPFTNIHKYLVEIFNRTDF